MAHFAKVKNNFVIEVIVVSNESCNNLPFPESEPIGQAFIASLNIDGDWVQTSYNANFHGCYAGIGYTFDPLLGEYGEFVPPPVEPVEPADEP